MPWRQERSRTPVFQTFSGGYVAGDLTMIGQQITYNEVSRLAFRLKKFSSDSGLPLTVEEARAQPSRLLDARLGVVGFTGRGRNLAWLEAWRDRRGGSRLSVVLIHGEGGSGKTRLARQFAQATGQGRWAVWQAAYEPAGSAEPLPERLTAGRDRGALLLVDYAERWPMAQLLDLVRHSRLASPDTPVRLLLLARSAGSWWDVLAHRLNREDVACDQRPLSSLPGGTRGVPGLFAAARDCFAKVLHVPGGETITVPDLSHRDFELVLGVHMAALVAVDARLHEADVPDDPARLSAYLLRRERDAWGSLRTNAQELGRTVYTAVLTGPLPNRDGVEVLSRAGLASTREAAQPLLDDHRVLYPPREEGTVLEPLYPDRLAEDFLALSTPRHGRTDSPSDPWAADMPAVLLAPDGPGATAPSWSRTGMTVLIETARRWEHIRTGHLYPLLREHPGLAVAAGSAALATLAELEDLDTDLLGTIESQLPDAPDFEFDLAYAALAQRMAERRLPATTDPAERARLRRRLGWRYSVAGLHEQALAQCEEAVDLYRELAKAEPGIHRRSLALALQQISDVLASLDRPQEALAVVEEAMGLLKSSDPDTPSYLPDLARVQLNLGDRLAALWRDSEALAVREEALRSYRQQEGADPQTLLWGLAAATNSLSKSYWTAGRLPEALALAEEGVALTQQLVAANRNAYLGMLAEALNVLGLISSDLGRQAQRLAAAQEAASLFRTLAKANPNAYLRPLADALIVEGNALAGSGRSGEALSPIEESLAIWRVLIEISPEAHRLGHANALNSFANRLSEVGRYNEGCAAARESVDMLHSVPDPRLHVFSLQLAESTATLGRRLADLGHAAEAIAATQESIVLQRQLVESDGEQWIPDLANALCSLCHEQMALGRDAEARAAAEEAVSLLRPRAADEAAYAGELARALRCLGQVLARHPDRTAEALALVEEAVAIRRILHQSEPGRNQFALADHLIELCWRLSAAGRGAEALPLTEEALSIGRALMKSDPDPIRLRLLVRTLMEYIWIRWETRHELPEALARTTEVEHLLRLRLPGHEPGSLGFTDIGHVLEVRASILTQLGRPEEAREVLRAMLAQKSTDKRFLDSLKPIRHPMLDIFGLSDMADLEHPRGAEALAVQMVTAEEGSAERDLARRLLRWRLRRENRADRRRLPAVPVGALTEANAPSAASLLADITAFEAVQPTRSIWERRSSAEKLARLGDPRGIEVLVAQALDTGLKYFHREEAARALIRAGDPRGRYLLAGQAADPSVSRWRRRGSADQLRTLGDPRAEELATAGTTSVGLTAAQEPGWPLTMQANAPGALNGVSPAAAAALRRLSDEQAKPERSPAYKRLARCLAALLLPLPPALALLIGESAAAASGSRPGPGNWIALCVSAYLLYMLTHELMSSAARFTAKAFAMNPEAKRYFFFFYVILMPMAAALGYLLAHSALVFFQPAGKFLWDILIWR